MSYIQVVGEGIRRARKQHQCFDCRRSIAPDTDYAFQTCAMDGRAYTICQHIDCRDLANEYRHDASTCFSDYDDGFPPLQDEWSDSGEHDRLCDEYRGLFPHAVCRMEWWKQIADMRRQDMLRALTGGDDRE